MAFPVTAWPLSGSLDSFPSSAQEEQFNWCVVYFLQECLAERRESGAGDKRVRSGDFSFGGATWNFFLSFDQEDCRRGLFGVNVRTHTAPDTEMDCWGHVIFQCSGRGVIKGTEFRWKCGSAGSHWKMRDVLSQTELDDFLQYGVVISCILRIRPSSVEEAPSLPGNDPTAFLEDETWPRGGDWLRRDHPSQWVTKVQWNISSFLLECRAARESSGPTCKKRKSVDFSFEDATFTLFASFDAKEHRSRLGIYFRTRVSSEEEFVCCCEIALPRKEFQCKFSCESAESLWTVTDFLSQSELDKFLNSDGNVYCTISRQTCSNREASSQTEVPSSSKSGVLEAHTQTEHLENDSTALLDEIAWPCGEDWLLRARLSARVTELEWRISSFLRGCLAARELPGPCCRKLKSRDFCFGEATFTLFASLDAKQHHVRLGIYFRTLVSTDEVYDCCCKIGTKEFRCQFRCESADSCWSVRNFLSHSELDEFLREGDLITCTVSRQIRSNSEACSQTEIPSSSESGAVEAYTQNEHLENEDQERNKDEEEIEDPTVKVCQDIKNFLCEEHSDSYNTDEVRDLFLRAQRSIHRAITGPRNQTSTARSRHAKGSGKHKDSIFWMAAA